MEMQEIRKNLKKDLDKYRYEHTKGVMYTAGCLAMANNYDVEKAMLEWVLEEAAGNQTKAAGTHVRLGKARIAGWSSALCDLSAD